MTNQEIVNRNVRIFVVFIIIMEFIIACVVVNMGVGPDATGSGVQVDKESHTKGVEIHRGPPQKDSVEKK